MSKVQRLIAEDKTHLSLNDLLDKAKVTENEYIDALEMSSTGNVVVLERNPNECFISLASERNVSFSISSREDWKSASSATVETSAEADSLCDSADEESCKFY